jgi:hypothetical protein
MNGWISLADIWYNVEFGEQVVSKQCSHLCHVIDAFVGRSYKSSGFQIIDKTAQK